MTEKDLLWKMYSKLFNTITDVLPLIENIEVKEMLKKAQIDTEEMYVSAWASMVRLWLEMASMSSVSN